MTNESQSQGKAARDAEKARRLAEALRANLARRKTRRRSIAEAETAGAADMKDEGAGRAASRDDDARGTAGAGSGGSADGKTG